jgi:hypothetical protein
MILLYKNSELKETFFLFVILIPFYLTNSTITWLTHQPPSLRLYRKLLYPNKTIATMLCDVEYIDGHKTSVHT